MSNDPRKIDDSDVCYPVEPGTPYWLLIDKSGKPGDWTITLRGQSRFANPLGMEIARFNSAVVFRHDYQICHRIVDALNGVPPQSV